MLRNTLEELYLWDNQITVINSQRLNSLYQLKQLDLTHNPLNTVPDITIFNLEVLYLKGCSLTEFPKIDNPASLEYFRVASNDIANIPDNYFMPLVSLKMLGIVGNPRLNGLITVPAGSSQILEVYASWTNITEIPAQTMASMDKLTTLYLSNVSIHSLAIAIAFTVCSRIFL